MMPEKSGIVFGFAVVLSCGSLSAASLDTNRLEQLTGLTGTLNAVEGVFKVTAMHNHFFFDEPKVFSCTSTPRALSSSLPQA